MNTALKNKKFRPSLSQLILLGLVLGVACGLFLGELAGSLGVVGKAYIGLIQMSILPYMVVSLIQGIGSLTYDKAGKLAITAGVVLLGSWVLAFSIIFVLPLAFPQTEAGAFYSPSLVEIAKVNFIELYIPSNPFSSLSRTIVPASAVFSVFVGIALIGVKKKHSLLEVLAATADTLMGVAKIVVRLTPIGVFAIAANATGTMTIEEFGRLQTYIVTFVVATLLLTFWVMPGLVAVLTPFGYRDVMRACRDALVTGFVTANLFIVLPILVENSKHLFEQYKLRNEDAESYVEVLVPTSFNFPNIGKLLTLLFVLFAGWFTGSEIALGEYPMFTMLGLFTLFGGVDLALPFLLDQMRIPSDMYQLYVVTGVVNSWFATLIAVMNLFAFTLVATCAATGGLRFNPKRLMRFVGITIVVFIAVIGLTRYGLSVVVSDTDKKLEYLVEINLSEPVPSVVHQQVPRDLIPADTSKTRLPQILERGVLRVGYKSDNLPFSYLNVTGELVGFDIDLAHRLARELGVELEFVPWEYDTLLEQLNAGQFDIVAGGLWVTTSRLIDAAFSEPTMTTTMAFVVKDYLRHRFTNLEVVEQMPGVKIGLVGEELVKRAERAMPETEIVSLDSYAEFFIGNKHALDAIAISAESGSAWTILYPDYDVSIIEPQIRIPVALAMAQGDQDFQSFMNNWLHIEKTEGMLDKFYDKWILGKSEQQKRPRWSVIRDVLHWVD